MPEKGPETPEPLNPDFTHSAERGRLHFSFKRALIGAAIGAIALPLVSFGMASLASHTLISPFDPNMIRLAVLQAVTGGALGGIIGGRELSRS